MPTSPQHLRALEDIAHELDLLVFTLEQRSNTSTMPVSPKLHAELERLRQRLVAVTRAIELD